MPISIQIPDDLYLALQALAIPFVDHEPADVIWRLVRGNGPRAVTDTPDAAASHMSSGSRHGASGALSPPASLAGSAAAPSTGTGRRTSIRAGRPGPPSTAGAERGLQAAPDGKPGESGLVASGVTIPNGLRLRFNYRGKILPGRVRDDRIWVGDEAHSSPSAAAAAAAMALGKPGSALNGWYYWEFEDPATPGEWHRLETLRREGQRRRRNRRN